jgi:hypothetical protein
MMTATPEPFGRERAQEIWSRRGLACDFTGVLTPGEDAYVRQIWDTLDGDASFIVAFEMIRHGRVGQCRARCVGCGSENVSLERSECAACREDDDA